MGDFNSYRSQHTTGDVNPWIKRNTGSVPSLQEENELLPWKQQPNESARAFSAFLLYLDLGVHQRSYASLGQTLYGNRESTTQIQKWAKEHDWVVRTEAWDIYCANTRLTRMETQVEESEEIMLDYLPKVTLRLCQVAAGEAKVTREEMRAITDFLDRVGPSKKRRGAPVQFNANLTISAPQLPGEIVQEVTGFSEAEVIEEQARNLIPEKLREKKKG